MLSLPWKRARIGEAAVGLHEHEPRARRQLGRDLGDIAAQDRREIGIDHGGVAAPDIFHQRAHLMADGDLGEADLAGELGHRALMGRMAIAMQEHDRDRADAARDRPPARPGARRARSTGVSTSPSAVTRSSTSSTRLIEQLRQDDMAGEDVGPVLIGDAQLVGEALAWSPAGCGRPCAPAAHWWRRSCPSSPPRSRAGIAWPGGSSSSSRMPWIAASRYCSGFSESSLWVSEPAVGPARHHDR